MSEIPPKVVLLAGKFEVRGTSAYTLRLAEHLGARGYDPLIVCADARCIEPERRAH